MLRFQIQAKLSTEVGQIGETGVFVCAITDLEQELGTELDLVPTLLHIAMAGIDKIVKTLSTKHLIELPNKSCGIRIFNKLLTLSY